MNSISFILYVYICMHTIQPETIWLPTLLYKKKKFEAHINLNRVKYNFSIPNA